MIPLLVTTLALVAPAAPRTFDFTDPKGTNTVTIEVNAPLEPVTGIAGGISGSATFDPNHPEKTTGEIVVAVDSIQFGNPNYAGSVRNYALEAKKHPQLRCRLQRIVSGKEVAKGHFRGKVAVELTVRGVTRPMTIPLDVRYLPGLAKERDGHTEGDLMVVRSQFSIRRSQFDVAPGLPDAVASDAIALRVALVGTAPQQKPARTVLVEGKPVALTERLAFHKVPSCTVVTLKDFTVAQVEQFGAATPKTLYPVGAQGKPLAALVALRLVQDKRLDLDTDINRYLKTWKVPENELTRRQPVTLRHLLAGTSGFTWQKYLGYLATAPLPTLEQVLRGEPPATTPPARVQSLPGSTFAVSSEEVSVLQKVVEDVTGQPWQDVAHRVFGAQWRSRYTPQRPLPDGALGHNDDGAPWPGGSNAYPELAAAGLWADPREFAEALLVILRSAAGKPAPLEPQWGRWLTTIPVGQQNNAFGCDDFNGRTLLYRGGNAKGYYCQFWADPKTGAGLLVFTDRDLCWQLANELRDTWLKGH